MTQEEIVDILLDSYDYSNTVYTSQLREMFGDHDEAVNVYIKPGREFWHYDGEKRDYRKLKVTYVRSGVVFFVFEDEPETEHAWFIGSFNCLLLHAAQIYPYEIGRILSKWHENAADEFPEICKQCKWDDCDGRITVEVIWDKDDNN